MACTPLQPLPACTSEVSGCAALHAQVLAQNGGTGWDLLTKLVVFEPGKRLSARAALRHPWFGAGLLGSVAQALDRVGSSMGDVSNAQCSRAAFSGCQQSFRYFICNAQGQHCHH